MIAVDVSAESRKVCEWGVWVHGGGDGWVDREWGQQLPPQGSLGQSDSGGWAETA